MADRLLLEGDMQSNGDCLLLEGDMQDNGDCLLLEGDMVDLATYKRACFMAPPMDY